MDSVEDEKSIRYYSRDKSKSYTVLWIPFLIFTILLLITIIVLLYISSLDNAWLTFQVWLVGAFFQAAFIIPYIIKHEKLQYRGHNYSDIGIDYENNKLFFRDIDKNEEDEFNINNIESLYIVEISSEAYLMTINNSYTYKIANEIIDGSIIKNEILNKKDNYFIVKMIAYLLSGNKDVQVFGPHWALRNLVNEKKINNQLKFHNKESEKTYIKNEKKGSGYYLLVIFLSLIVMALSIISLNMLTVSFITGFFFYFIYKYFSNYGFMGKVVKVNIDFPISEDLKSSIIEMNPEMAYILTIPNSIMNPYDRTEFEMEKVLIIYNSGNMFIKSAGNEIV